MYILAAKISVVILLISFFLNEPYRFYAALIIFVIMLIPFIVDLIKWLLSCLKFPH